MNISKNNKFILFLAFISLILCVVIFQWINYLSTDDYVYYVSRQNQNTEGFDKGYITDGYTTTVNLPLNTRYSCKNMCGPTARCSITGQQCLADIDCPGCQPQGSSKKNKTSEHVPGDNDSGKLTVGVTPTYSSLTTDIGTTSAIFKNNIFKKTPSIANGVNTWREKFNITSMFYDTKFKPPQLPNMPIYSKRYSVTGEFIDNGPLASNAYIRNE
jgi:hypothetical protein